MSLRLIYGRAGTGKSQFCLNKIKEQINNKTAQKIYLVVPEQFSFSTEKRLLETLEQNSVINAEVITFKRMAHRIFTEIGGLTEVNLSKTGKAMLVSNILEKYKKDLQFLNKSSENIDIVLRTITELKKHDVKLEDLEQKQKETEDEYLKIKLNDINTIYKKYEETLQNKYIDEDDILTILAKKIEESSMFDNSYIYIDEFSGFTRQEYNVIKELLKKAKEIDITICSDEINIQKQPEEDIFYQNKMVIQELIKCAHEVNVNLEENIELKNTYRFKNEELKHLEKNIYEVPYKIYEKPVNNIHISLLSQPYSEVEYVAKTIIELVREKKYRYKDISVITKNIDEYTNIVKAIFEKYEIPVFIDQKEDLSQNILVKYVLSILEIYAKSWSQDAVLAYIKTGFLPLEKEDIYNLENYCKKWGIKGNKWYKEDWKYDRLNKDVEKLNELRRKIVEPLLKLKTSLDESKLAEEITTKLYRFLEENQIREKLEEKAEKLEQAGRKDVANKYKSSWNILMQIFDEIVLIFSQDKMSFKQYKNILKVGLEFSSLGEIPQVIDQVIIGDTDRSRNHKAKVVFILGLNDGVFPAVNSGEGFLNDKDRNYLKQNGIELAKGTIENLYEDQFNIYRAFTTAENELYLSYVSTDKEQKAKRQSILISRIKKMFKNLKEESDVVSKNDSILTAESTFNQMLSNIKDFKQGKEIDEIWFAVYNWYMQNDEWKPKLKEAIKGFSHKNDAEKITEENIKRLYGNTLKTSVSRLEQYRECPFSFHLKYGLKLKEREEFVVRPIDTGSFMHEVIDEFFENTRNIKTIENQEIKEIVNNIIDEKLSLSKNYIFTSTPRFAVLTNILKKAILQSITYVVQQMKNSDFEIAGNEIEFNRKIDNVEITGKIDRIDTAQNEQGKYIRIIDYKSSDRSINLNELEAGTQIQLLTYLDTAVEKTKNIPVGMLYFNLIDPVIKASRNLTDEQIQEELKKQFRMSGMVLADVNIIRMMDKNLQTGASSTIPVTLDKNGDIMDSRSNAITKEQFTLLQNKVKKIIKQIAKEILEGNIEIKPTYNKGKKEEACKYCEYKSICCFNPNVNNYSFIDNKSKKELLDNLQ